MINQDRHLPEGIIDDRQRQLEVVGQSVDSAAKQNITLISTTASIRQPNQTTYIPSTTVST
jgi:hypothetical protein